MYNITVDTMYMPEDTSLRATETIYYDEFLSIENGKIKHSQIIILNPLHGDHSNIWGKWEYSVPHLSIHFRDLYTNKLQDKPSIRFNLICDHYYEFFEDSSRVSYGWKYFDENVPDYDGSDEFTYQDSLLNINDPNYGYEVSFNDNKMYWLRVPWGTNY